MFVQSLPFVFFLASLLSLFTATRAWAHRDTPAARSLAMALVCAAAWVMFDGLELAATNLTSTVFFAKMAYPFRLTTVVLLFRFSLEFTGKGDRLNRRLMLLLSIIPAFAVLLTFTNEWHHLNWSSTTWLPELNMVYYSRGPLFWVQVVYIYGLFVGFCILLIQNSFRQRSLFRLQSLSIVLAMLMPIASNAIYLLRIGAYSTFDLTSLAFLLTGILLNFAMHRFRFLDLMPVARHMLVDKMAEGMIVLDSQRRVVDINPAAQVLLGLSKVKLGQVELLPTWFPLPVQFATDTVQEISTPDRDLNVHCAPLSGSDQNQHLGWLILVRDVTERVRAERELRLLNSTLESQIQLRIAEIKAEQERADAILRSMGDALATVDLAKQITYVNPILEEWTGYALADLIHQPISMLGLDLTEILAKRTLGRVGRGYGSVTRRNGTTYPAALTVAPMRDHSGALIGYVVSHTDRSRDLALEQARSQFINSISHELRTPVTNVDLYVQLLTKALTQNRTADMARYVATLNEQTQQLKLLIHAILTVAELDSKPSTDADSQHQALAPYPLFVEVQRRQQPAASQKELSITLHDAPVETPGIRGQQARLLLALEEILKNAICYTPAQGKIDLRIRVNAAEQPGEVGFEVQDTGIGFSEKDKKHAFDRFYRGEVADAGDIPGSGLGLNIAATIARNHHGRIDLAGAVGEGACVTLWLPAVQPSSDTPVEPSAINPQPQDGRQFFTRLSKPKHLSAADR